ncbi:pyridoxal phosphate-dependent aminotransferase [soil metagenome]
MNTLPRPEVQALKASRIREVANAGIGLDGILPFWFGEPDHPTAMSIREAARESLAAGETFYSHNLGLPALRATLSRYLGTLHGRPVDSAAIAVTSSGVNALMIVHQALTSPGDRVVVVTPVWPNLTEAPRILGANVVRVALDFDAARGWTLDLDRLLDALTPGTRTLVVNSPNNPTGWTLTADQQRLLLDHCRKLGIWIVADDVYERIWFGGRNAAGQTCAPSFLDIATPDDRVVSTNSFSKAWRMTGWRLGWFVAPADFVEQCGKLLEYNTSCAPVFVQRAGIEAVEHGEQELRTELIRYRAARDHLAERLARIDGVDAPAAPGAMYAFFRMAGMGDSVEYCKRLVREERLGLAPGSAFGPEGDGFVRWCFASDLALIDDGLARFARLRSGSAVPLRESTATSL